MMVFFSFLSGLIFGLGLIISGMANPAKVLGFLDLSSPWDPSLALVMMGAILVGLIGFSVAKRRQYSFCHTPIQLPTQSHIDWRLMIGAILFGLGWGVAGICPGPALILLGAGYIKAVVFILAMLLGIWIIDLSNQSK